MLVTMKPTRGNSSPWCHSTLAITRRGAVPTPRLIPEVVVPDDGLLRRPSHRPPQQRGDLPLQHLVAGEPDSVEDAPLLHVLVDLRLGEGGIGPEVPAHSRPPVAGHDGIQHLPPVVGAVDIPRTQHGPLAVPELVEDKDRVIARAARLAHLPAMMLTYAAQMRGLLADHDTPTGLIWEMWVSYHSDIRTA